MRYVLDLQLYILDITFTLKIQSLMMTHLALCFQEEEFSMKMQII